MRFGEIQTKDAVDAIVAHRTKAGNSVFHKGHVLTESDVAILLREGVTHIWVAQPDTDDIEENTAADKIAMAVNSRGISNGKASTGRINFYAAVDGVFEIDPEIVNRINLIDSTVTLATLRPFHRVHRNQIVATLKIIPYAVHHTVVDEVMGTVAKQKVFSVEPFLGSTVGLIQCTGPNLKLSILEKTRRSVEARVTLSHGVLSDELRTDYTIPALTEALASMARSVDLIVVFGASAIADQADIVPRAIAQAGGVLIHVGMPVDPGNLLVIGEIDGKPVIGAPGCGRSIKANGFDMVLDRLMAGIKITSRDIALMGVGGLLADVPRPQPRRTYDGDEGIQSIAIAVLAAGRSSRMGADNKLLARFNEVPLVRQSVSRALEAGGNPVIVVTGHMAANVAAAIDDLSVQKVFNPAFSTGLASSLKCAVSATPSTCSGLLIHLADMPKITTEHIVKLMSAFRAENGQVVIRATANGRRGNPVILPRVFFDLLFALEGDVGARALIETSGFPVLDVELGSGALVDVDTLETLQAAGGALDV